MLSWLVARCHPYDLSTRISNTKRGIHTDCISQTLGTLFTRATLPKTTKIMLFEFLQEKEKGGEEETCNNA